MTLPTRLGWAAFLILIALCCASASALAQGMSEGRRIDAAAPRTIQACRAIAALANRGARALRAADLLGRGALIDLRNDGHPKKIVRKEQGTAHWPYLVDESGIQVTYDWNAYVDDAIRFASEIAVVRVNKRFWEIVWTAEGLDGNAWLGAATDGTAVCHFGIAERPPVFRMLPGGVLGESGIYRTLLFGHGLAPPSAGLDAEKVQAASDFKRYFFGSDLNVQSSSWFLDLLNNGKPITLIRVQLASGAGRGCDRDMLSLVEGGRIAAVDSLSLLERGGHLAPLSQALKRLVRPLSCMGLVETPVLGRNGRAYVLLDNLARDPGLGHRVRLLVGVRGGVVRALARLVWAGRNYVDLPSNPATGTHIPSARE